MITDKTRDVLFLYWFFEKPSQEELNKMTDNLTKYLKLISNKDSEIRTLDIKFVSTKEKSFNLKKGECIVVPKGVLHRPKTDSSATVLLFELKETKQYGD